MAYLLTQMRKHTVGSTFEEKRENVDAELPVVASSVDLQRQRRQDALVQQIAEETQQLGRALCEFEDKEMVDRLSETLPAPEAVGSAANAMDDDLAIERTAHLHLLRKLKDTVNYFVVEAKRSKTQLGEARHRADQSAATVREVEFLQGEVRRLKTEAEEVKRLKVPVANGGELTVVKTDLRNARVQLTEAACLVRMQMTRIADKNAEIALLQFSVKEKDAEISPQQQMSNRSAGDDKVISHGAVMVHHHHRSSQPGSPALSRASSSSDNAEIKAAKSEVARLQRELQNSARVSLPAPVFIINNFAR
jgi:hypothetical protein